MSWSGSVASGSSWGSRQRRPRPMERMLFARTHKAAMEEALWLNRRDTWSTAPALPPEAEAVVAHYFRDGARRAPHFLLPDRQLIMGVLLAQKGNAPGVDGMPYEFLRQGGRFVTEVLYQAFQGPQALR